MMQKVLLFFSCEPGGAEVLVPVIKLVTKETSHKVIVLSYGLGAERFAHKEIEYIEVDRVEKNDCTVMNTHCPDLVITSAASLPERDMSEKYLWHNVRQAGVPTMALLDQWQNYAVRFSGSSAMERLAYLPDYINCINEIGEKEMVEEGFDPHCLVKLGQPYLSSFISDAKLVDVHKIKNRLGIAQDQQVVLFASEAIREHYGHSRGYDQYDALRLFFELMSNATQETVLLIKLHPKDTPKTYERILSEYSNLHLRIVKNELSSMESILISDEVYGMTSIMLVEAYISGKKTVSLQPGLVVEDPCVLSRYGVIPTIISKNVAAHMQPVLFRKSDFKFDFEFQENGFLEFLDLLQLRH